MATDKGWFSATITSILEDLQRVADENAKESGTSFIVASYCNDSWAPEPEYIYLESHRGIDKFLLDQYDKDVKVQHDDDSRYIYILPSGWLQFANSKIAEYVFESIKLR